MKIDMEKTKALMEQVELWLKSSESEIRMDLTLCKTGTPDTFKVRYDADRIGLLVLMLETDADLCDVAYSAMLKYFADMSDQEREESLREFATLCREIYRHMEAELSKGGRSEIDRNKLYN